MDMNGDAPHPATQRPESEPEAAPSVELKIGELVLAGFPNVDRVHVGQAVRYELARLMAERGAPSGLDDDGEIPLLDAGEFEFSHDADAATIGSRIARAVYNGLRGGLRR